MGIVNCAGCNKAMGEMTGRLIKGWVLLCENCNDKRKAAEWAATF